MNSPREIYAYHVGSTADTVTFEVRFHDGYQKKFTVDRKDCIRKGCSARELLEDQIIDLYVSLEGFEPNILFYFS